ncbi:MAG: hypothetical protein OHK0012_08240 [Synechococcales cyanobacterium]
MPSPMLSTLQRDPCPAQSRSSPDLRTLTPLVLSQDFEDVWQLDTRLMNSITDPAVFYQQPDPLRNPLIFYLGHSAAFLINKLVQAGLLPQGLRPEYERLFEMGVDPAQANSLTATVQKTPWPAVEEVWHYRQQVYHTVHGLIERLSVHPPVIPTDPLWAVLMGIEHGRIHVETSSMLIRQVDPCSLQRPPGWHYAGDPPIPPQVWLDIPGGEVQMGKPTSDSTFGWDIEYGQRPVTVPPFVVTQHLISHQDFLQFVQSGGYTRPQYWDPQAWQWKEAHRVRHPKFWLPQGHPTTAAGSSGLFRYRAMYDVIDLPLSWPVEVNHYEASAYCRWYTERHGEAVHLVSEAEWQWMLSLFETEHSDYHLYLHLGSPRPVHSPKQDQALVPHDLRGNVWEWTRDPFTPLAGFAPHPLYPEHAAPFFDQDHRMMLGGSWISQGSMAGRYYRNWFRPHFYQHAGFRLVKPL